MKDEVPDYSLFRYKGEMKCKNKNVITIKEENFYQKIIMWALKGIILPLNLHINRESINSVQYTHRDMIWNKC